MSNLVHRRRRCARIVPYMILLPGGQYARGWERSLSPGEGYRCGSRGAFLFSFLQKPIRPIRPIRLIRGRTEISRGQVFILVYRLAMDAKTLEG